MRGEEVPRATAPGSVPTSFLDFLEHLYYTPLMNETLTRTICIKLDVGDQEAVLHETQRQFNAAATWIAAVCWDERITNTNTAHHRVYGETRSRFGLGAQLAGCARAKAMEAIKAVKTQDAERMARWRKEEQRRRATGRPGKPPPEAGSCPQFGPRGSIRYDARTYRLLSLDRVSLNTMRGRITCRLLPGKRQHDMLVDPAWEIGGADLVWRRGVYYLHVTQHCEAARHPPADEAIGVDLGIVHVATDSTGERFTGAKVREARSRFVARRAALQRVGTRSAKRRLKQMSGREQRFMRDVNHRIAKALVHKAVVSRKALALEDLTGIRDRTMARREHRYERHSWAFYQLRLFLTYKAAWTGVPVRFVDPAYTSQTCSICGHAAKANRHSQASFQCQQCGFCCNADYNAAINISLAEPVKRPIVAPVRR